MRPSWIDLQLGELGELGELTELTELTVRSMETGRHSTTSQVSIALAANIIALHTHLSCAILTALIDHPAVSPNRQFQLRARGARKGCRISSGLLLLSLLQGLRVPHA